MSTHPILQDGQIGRRLDERINLERVDDAKSQCQHQQYISTTRKKDNDKKGQQQYKLTMLVKKRDISLSFHAFEAKVDRVRLGNEKPQISIQRETTSWLIVVRIAVKYCESITINLE